MKRSRLLLLSALVVSTIIGSAIVVSFIRAPQADNIPQIRLFNYTAKWICNTPFTPPGFNGTLVNTGAAESIGLVPGEYKTDINVHNPGPTNVTIVKKFVLSVAESPFLPTPANTAFSKTFAGPDVAFFITCDEIQALLRLPAGHAFKGFAILQTTVSNLDVVAEYSSEAFDFPPECPSLSFPPFASTNCVEGLTLDVEKIAAVPTTTPLPPPTTCSPSSTITISPSTLTVQKGFNGSATIVITNSPCTTITECFTVTVAPSVSGGPTAFVFPSCVTIPPSGSASATLILFVPTTAPSGPYTVTVTATCAACVPPLVQIANVALTVL